MERIEHNAYYKFDGNGGHVRFNNGDRLGSGTVDTDVVDVLIDRALVRFDNTGLDDDGNVLQQLRGLKNLMLLRDGKKQEFVTAQTEMSLESDNSEQNNSGGEEIPPRGFMNDGVNRY